MLLGSTVMESWCAHFCIASTLWGVEPSWCMLFLRCIASVLLTSTAMESWKHGALTPALPQCCGG
eukprot:1138943-Pelagomonas_calceolata.AAC.3